MIFSYQVIRESIYFAFPEKVVASQPVDSWNYITLYYKKLSSGLNGTRTHDLYDTGAVL